MEPENDIIVKKQLLISDVQMEWERKHHGINPEAPITEIPPNAIKKDTGDILEYIVLKTRRQMRLDEFF